MHTSPAICRVGRVPLREAFRGSVITCSRNNERLILSSWLATPSPPLSLFLFRSAENGRSVATYRPFVVSLSQSFCEHESFDCSTFCTVFTCSTALYISPARCLGEHSVVFRERRYRFVSYAFGLEYALIAVERYGSARRTGEAVGSRFVRALDSKTPSVLQDGWLPKQASLINDVFVVLTLWFIN